MSRDGQYVRKVDFRTRAGTLEPWGGWAETLLIVPRNFVVFALGTVCCS